MPESLQGHGASPVENVELPVVGMDCANCVASVRKAIANVGGVDKVEVLLAAEKAVITFNPDRTTTAELRQAVERAGYRSPQAQAGTKHDLHQALGLSRRVIALLGIIFATVLLVVVAGEWFGLLGKVTERIPFWLGAAIVLSFGFPVFRAVLRNAVRGRIVSHTLMSSGALAALAIGEWTTAALVVFFMRVGDYAERATTRKARSALRDLASLAPQTARLIQDGQESVVPVADVQVGDMLVVRPGEPIPVDGEVVGGGALIDQAAITGESMPVEALPGKQVYAATMVSKGSLRIRAEVVAGDSTFAKILTQVEEAEANRGDAQMLADRFSAWYLPLVAAIAALTYLFSRDLLAAVAVTVVACSCAFALATPVAMLASIGAAARHGLLIRGGRYIEALAKADMLLLDKTGTATLGRPRITDVVPLAGNDAGRILALAAAAERDSEHPLAEAVRREARERGLDRFLAQSFEASPGLGVKAMVEGHEVTVGSRRTLGSTLPPTLVGKLEEQGKTVSFVLVDGELAGVLAAEDTLREEARSAIDAARRLGIGRVEMLTGDNESSARAIAGRLGVHYRANLLPEDKIRLVKRYQREGRTVIMVGDGVNDAPALAQADVGIAMGSAGTAVAVESAHVALMRDDLGGVPELLRLARRTMTVVRFNLGFTAVYNVIGISLAAAGLLPPIFAAALQSVPDLGIMGNSARLLRHPKKVR